ncbi:MAG TPA: ferredoxin family protein [Solirubrobacteraceae bacterium]|nr:ferredoxin family protein [Solirubrobacteraceae bacterium]
MTLSQNATFIGIEVDDAVAADTELAAKLTEVCPVDIYAQNEDGTLRLVEENIDECVLCELCINATPAGSVKVLKLYSGESLPA